MTDKKAKEKNTIRIALIGGVVVAVILVLGTLWMGQTAKRDTEAAVRSVSLLYLDELAGRREQVVASNLQNKIENIHTAIDLMTQDDLSDIEHLQAYQARMKKLYSLEKFAFVDENGLIYTSLGTQDNIKEYSFDYQNIPDFQISIFNLKSNEKKVVIAVPAGDLSFEGQTLILCFMEIDMKEMLQGVSMGSGGNETTFCNIYTKDGVALSNSVLGGLAMEDNLLDAMKHAVFEKTYSYEGWLEEFTSCNRGEVSFQYGDIKETLCYVPIEGTDWLLTYLIRESVIAEKINSVSNDIVTRCIVQSGLTAIVMIVIFIFIIFQIKRNNKLAIEKETADIENRVKQEEMKQKLALQEQLLEEEKQRTQQMQLITALSSDYWSVYYIELDKDEGVCYQAHSDVENGLKLGQRFRYLEEVTKYAQTYVTEDYRKEFLNFVQPDSLREELKTNRVISYRYKVLRHGKESYEMVRVAGIQPMENQEDDTVHAVGACFTNVDEETRRSIAQNHALESALAAAEQASKAKTAFLSNMSHEIRTPMNAIIGHGNIALNDPEISDKTKDYLTKIGDSAEHLLNLINDILDMSRIESGRLVLKNEEFSFSKLLETINTMFSGQCAAGGLDYRCHIVNQIDGYYIGDNMKLRQVLINILGNAVKFTPQGGRVSLTVERIAKYKDKSTLRFTIEDTGIGMSREFLPQIFETFSQENSSSTNKYGSSGLGLAITKSIVEMMNGNIQVESEKGIGTVFTVTVTLRNVEKSEESDIMINPNEMSVLVIDDDSVDCEHARLILEKSGIACDVASSGEEAIEMARLRHARHDPYNLILVDWKMPDMDGVETTRKIRDVIGHESAIVILTAYRWDDVLDEATNAGVDGFISKPLFTESVLEEFNSALRRKDAGNHHAGAFDLSGRTVLIAEDMEINAEILKITLQMEGVESELAVSGRQAVDMFSASEEGHYSAILMDMRMPEMDGLEATRAIRDLDRPDAKTIPIIALTANAFDEDVQRSLQAGLNAHLSKPIKPDVLFETLRDLIRQNSD